MENQERLSAFDLDDQARKDLDSRVIFLELPALSFMYLAIDLLAASNFYSNLYGDKVKDEKEDSYSLEYVVALIQEMLSTYSQSAFTLIEWSKDRYLMDGSSVKLSYRHSKNNENED